jgi:hypothetical protein
VRSNRLIGLVWLLSLAACAAGARSERATNPVSRPAPPSVQPAPARAHPRRDGIVRAFAEDPAQPERSAALPEPCRKLTGSTRVIERCSLALLANGTAPSVSVIYDCGQHLCSYDTYVWYGPELAPQLIAGQLGQSLEVSPDHLALIVSRVSYQDDVPFAPIGGETRRVDRVSGATTALSPCFSTRLSPGGKWYVCRNVKGDVLRFPVAGGALTRVAEARLPPGQQLKLGGPFDDYPATVEFPTPLELEYELYLLESEEVVRHRVPWHE